MSDALQRYIETRGGTRLPLPLLRERLEATGAAESPEELGELARAAGLPVASVRSALGYYLELAPPAAGPRVCMGTSCHLAGAAALRRSLRERGGCREVYCLGHCDRSPAVLREDGGVVAPCAPMDLEAVFRGDRPPPPAPPSIRCAAREPIVTRRIGRGDFSGLDAARRDGAYEGLRRALALDPMEIVRILEASGERGRGGAGFATGTKWRLCAEAAGRTGERFAIANGDEGDPGSFIDRVLMEQDPHGVLEGLAICARAVGAARGIVFIRSEYPLAIARQERAIEEAAAAGFLGGPGPSGGGFPLEVSIFRGMGSYVCGEETALINALEGNRGEVRLRPPYPAQQGLFGRPTVVNNVETLVNVPWILLRGAAAFRGLGTPESSGTKAMCLNHGFARPGIVEVEFGTPLRVLVEEHAGGGAAGERLEAVLLGGPMGSVLAPGDWDIPICYGGMSRRGMHLGHGGLVAVREGADLRALFLHWLRFMRDESCGKCVPCRLGSQRALELARTARGDGDRRELQRLLEVMAEGSLCAFGQEIPGPLRAMLERFGDRVLAAPREAGP